MKNGKLFVLIGVALVLARLLGACANDSSPQPSTEDKSTTQSAANEDEFQLSVNSHFGFMPAGWDFEAVLPPVLRQSYNTDLGSTSIDESDDGTETSLSEFSY